MRTPRVLWLLPALILSACAAELQHDLTEDDANEIYVLLQGADIDANKIKEGEGKDVKYIITVPKANIATAAQLLKDNSLPRPMAVGLAVFKQTKGMIPTQTEERAMFIEALGGEASNALNRIPRVLEARVIVMIPEVTDLTQPELKAKPSSSVLLKYIPGDSNKPPVSVSEVQDFVSRAVPELPRDNVTVLMIPVTPNKVDPNDGDTMMSHLGVRLKKSSVGTFRTLIALPTILFLGVTFAFAFFMTRKPSPKGNGNGARRPKQPPPEG